MKSTFLLIPILVFLSLLPIILLGPGGYDMIFHIVWSHNFGEQFWSGDLYPRWLHNLNAGCGGPDFYFYPPLAFYIGSLFYFLDGIEPVGLYPLLGTAFIALTLAGYAFYHWAKHIVSKEAAMAGAILYILQPYVFHDIYTRFSYTELFAFVWAPLLLHFTHQIALEKKGWTIKFIIIYALQLVSNIPTTVVNSMLLGLYFLFVAKRSYWLKGTATILFCVVVAFLLVAFYLLPVIYNMPLVWIGSEAFYEIRFMNYTDAFLLKIYDDWTPGEIFVHYILTASIVFVGIMSVVTLYIIKRHNNKKVTRNAIFWCATGMIGVFMTSPLSEFVYEMFPFLIMVQRPVRFLIIQAFAMSMLVVLLFSFYKNKKQREYGYWNIGAGVMCLVLPFALIFLDFSRRPMTGPPVSAKHEYIQKLYSYDIVMLHEYIPLKTDISWLFPDKVDEFAAECKNQRYEVTAGKARVDITKWDVRDIELSVSSTTKSEVKIGQLYYENWDIKNIDTGAEYEILPSEGKGLITIKVPPGKHKISLKMEKQKEEIIGFIISFLTALILSGIYYQQKKAGQSK